MDTPEALISLGIALCLGLLVGIQRQRADSALAGIRTFPLITIFGALCGQLAQAFGGWALAGGLLALAAATAMGNFLRPRADSSPGITTEVAALVMFACGAMIGIGERGVAAAVGVVTAILLAAKAPMHRFAGRISDQDYRAVLQFALVSFVVLPVLPDRPMGPLGAFNPHQIWLMVVLVVGIGLAAYIAYKLLNRNHAAILAGLLGGLISSTATTAAQARSSRAGPGNEPAAWLVVTLASTVVFARVLVEIFAASRARFWDLAPPIFAMLAVGLLLSAGVLLLGRSRLAHAPAPSNPTQLRTALAFAAVFAIVNLASAWAKEHSGAAGLFTVAAFSGLSDMDAITLSAARMAGAGEVAPAAAWRAILIAACSNLAFKGALVAVLGSRELRNRVLLVFGLMIAAAVGIVVGWPA